MKEFIGKIVAADKHEKIITIECEDVSGAILGQTVVLSPLPPKTVMPVGSDKHQPLDKHDE